MAPEKSTHNGSLLLFQHGAPFLEEGILLLVISTHGHVQITTLQVGCNDMGGSIMNESITKAAGVPALPFNICNTT